MVSEQTRSEKAVFDFESYLYFLPHRRMTESNRKIFANVAGHVWLDYARSKAANHWTPCYVFYSHYYWHLRLYRALRKNASCLLEEVLATNQNLSKAAYLLWHPFETSFINQNRGSIWPCHLLPWSFWMKFDYCYPSCYWRLLLAKICSYPPKATAEHYFFRNGSFGNHLVLFIYSNFSFLYLTIQLWIILFRKI